MKELDEHIICGCYNVEHSIFFRTIDGDDDVYMSIHLVPLPFFKRLINGIKYIFGYRSKYGDFDEIIITKKDAGKLRKFSDHKGYKQCMLRKDGKAYNKFVHRLVANAFLSTPQEGQIIDHINGVRDDNRVENLRWCSQDENLHFPLAKEHREHLCKVCSQYNLDGTYVATYKSSFEAEKITGIKCGSIDNCCKGKKLSCGGFQWEYGESTESISPIRQSMRKICVAKYDEQGNFITAYSSCREAARENNLTFQVISECINGKRKTSYGGFVWKKLIENS